MARLNNTHTVLIVCDEPGVLRGYLRALCNQPYEVLTAENGPSAMELLIDRNVDLMVLDARTPGASGAEFLAWAENRCPDALRIVLTEYASVDVAMKANNEDRTHRFLTKPCSAVDLAITIHKALEYKDLLLRNRELLQQVQGQKEELQQTQQYAERQTQQLRLRTEELQVSRVAAEQAKEAKSTFLANVSHEICTPMNAILGFSRLLLKANLPKEQLENVQFINTAGESLHNLLNELLDFSEIEAGEMTLDGEAFLLENLLQDLTDLGRSLVDEKAVRVAYELEKDIPAPLRGDRARLQQILNHLLSNAAKFTAEGKITIQASCEKKNDQTVELRFEVADSGIGIPRDRQEHIFENFTQADGSTTRKYGGTGLGLALSRRLVGLMNGEIGVRSVAGEGSTFWFTVVLEKINCKKNERAVSKHALGVETATAESEPAASPNDASPTEFSETQATRPAIRVLVVDDDPLVRKYIQRLLKRMHCTIEEAVSGLDAVQKSKTEPYDVIFMDVQMPELDGWEATLRIRSDDASPSQQAKIIAVTACTLAGDGERCLAAGMDDYLFKPLDVDEFLEMFHRYAPELNLQ